MRNNRNAVFVLNGCGNGNGSRPFPDHPLFNAPIRVLPEFNFIAVGSDVDIFGTKIHQGVNGPVNPVRITSFQGWQQFKRKNRLPGLFNNFSDFHFPRFSDYRDLGRQPAVLLHVNFPACSQFFDRLIGIMADGDKGQSGVVFYLIFLSQVKNDRFQS